MRGVSEGFFVCLCNINNYRCTKDFGLHSRRAGPDDIITCLADLSQQLTGRDHSISAEQKTATDQQKAISDNKWLQRMPFSPGVHVHTSPGRGHDLEVSLYSFIASWPHCVLPHCIPTKSLILAFIKWVHRHSAVASALISHRPSASSKFSICLCYERHVERTMGVTLRGALTDNYLTIQGDLR